MQPLPRCGALLRQTTARRVACSVVRRASLVQTRSLSGPEQLSEESRPNTEAVPPRRGGGSLLGFVAVFALSAGAVYYFYPSALGQDFTPKEVAKNIKNPKSQARPKPAPLAEDPASITAQHDQVKESWENPGVYLWGSNAGKVVAPDSNEAIIKTPRRVPYFNGKILRDLKLRHDFGAAVTETGDLLLWGGRVSPTEPEPVPVLTNKDLVKLAVSADRVIALSSGGTVYSVPVSRQDQLAGRKMTPTSSSWIPFWSSPQQSPDSVNYRVLTPQALKSGERVVDVSSGLEHCLMLTSKGRVFSAAATTLEFPSKGQMGVPGLTWATRPAGPYDQAHQVATPAKSQVIQIAAGDLHSALLDKQGKLYVFGDNACGQLGYAPGGGKAFVDTPTEIDVERLYENSEYTPKITSVAAGGMATFFTVDGKKAKTRNSSAVATSDTPQTTADVWACGNGVYGTLGNGKFIHASVRPSKVKSLSSVFEFDEYSGKLVPIKIAQLSVGTTHASAVMANATKTSGGRKSSDVNFGSDVLFWGGNEYFQLGTGKRRNMNSPVCVAALGSTDSTQEGGRMQVAPRKTVKIEEAGKGRKVSVEQRVECGGLVTGVYSAT